jgi:uncharacterized protein (DUF2147 family)
VSKRLFPASAATLRLPGVCAVLLWSILPTQAQPTPQPPLKTQAPQPAQPPQSTAQAAQPAQPPQAVAPSPVGEWLVAKKVARIRIASCDNRMWGVVSWEAQAGVDSKNPDPRLRERPTLGMPIILGMKPTAGGNKWEGEIYSAENGKTYSANISLRDENTLQVQGCVLSVLCGGENWARVEEPQAAPAPPPPQPRKQATKRAAEPPPPSENDKICASVAGTTGSTH